ncbi:MAG: hypothetical protein WAV53_01535, partial [Anaerolineae bacterium]
DDGHDRGVIVNLGKQLVFHRVTLYRPSATNGFFATNFTNFHEVFFFATNFTNFHEGFGFVVIRGRD